MSRMPGSYEEEDEWYYSERERDGIRHIPGPRRPSRPPYYPDHHSQTYLMPGGHATVGHGLHRSRSHGHSPRPSYQTPNVTIYNTLDADQNPRITQQSPLPSPRGSPRGRRVADEWIEGELAEMRLEMHRRDRSRSRPRYWEEGPSSADTKLELELTKERLREKERNLEEERLREQWKNEADYRREKELRKMEREKDKAERERRRIIDEENLRMTEAKREQEDLRRRARDEWEREEREAKAERQAAVDAWERKKRQEEDEAEESRKRLIAEYEAKKIADAKKAKEAEDELRMKIKLEEQERKEKEEREYKEFLRRQKEKEEEEEAKKKAVEEKLEAEMAHRLARFGFQNNQIQAMIKPEKKDELAVGLAPSNPYPWGTGHQPTYPKIHRDYLSIDTLAYFDIPWEYDRVSCLAIENND
jgi:hypothetical protein